MKAVCVLTGTEINWPCAARGCSLYGDCLVNYEKATEKPPMTNADRIRAMTDEELAEFMDRCEMSDIDYGKTFCDLCNGQYECDQCRLEWLQQPCGGADSGYQ